MTKGEESDKPSSEEADPPTRDRGVLTSADRDFINNPDSYGRTSAYERQQYIRERVCNSLYDFKYLRRYLRESDDNQPLEDFFSSETDVGGARIPGKALGDVLAFVYAVTLEVAEDRSFFETLLEDAIAQVEAEHDRTVRTFRFEVEQELVLPWDKIKTEAAQRGGLTPRLRRSIMHHLTQSPHEIDTEEAVNLLQSGVETLDSS
jgi:hypothetical protein